MTKLICKGVGGCNKVVRGEVIEWEEEFLENPSLVKEKIVYNRGNAPLYRMAFLIDHGVKAVLMEEGGKNYHPLILLNDAKVPAVAGVGEISLHGGDVTVDSGNGVIYRGEAEFKKKEMNETRIAISDIATKVYVNVGYPTALESAAKTGADGIGLLRTEYTAVRTLSRILNAEIFKNMTIREAVERYNEADVIYRISKDRDLRDYLKTDLKGTIKDAMKYFGEKEIIVRTFDIARNENDLMGNRGIRRCVGEGGHTIKIVAEAIKESLEEERGDYNIGVILPLVSHYSQIKAVLDIFLDFGLRLKGEDTQKPQIRYGWEIEQPAASQNNELWLEAFKAERGRPPDFIGIGTNDLTQFTVALGRNVYTKGEDLKVKNYLDGLYDENDFSVVRQIYEVSKQCKKVGTKLFLLGQAAAKQEYAELMLSFDIIPSVDASSVRRVKFIASEFEKRGDSKEEVIRRYIENLCDKQYPSVKSYIKPKILRIFGMGC